jgi:transcriptional regulator with XRE-family HTH domain
MSKRLASARTDKGLTQSEAAKKMNISLRDYNNFEKNGAFPTKSQKRDILSCLGVHF